MNKKIELSPEAVALLQRVKGHILATPERIRMNDWVSRGNEIEDLVADEMHMANPPCGTVACIAGWVVELGMARPKSVREGNVRKNALRLLKLSGTRLFGDYGQPSHALFHPEKWPFDLRRRLPYRSGTPEYAAVVAEAIDLFIANPEEFSS